MPYDLAAQRPRRITAEERAFLEEYRDDEGDRRRMTAVRLVLGHDGAATARGRRRTSPPSSARLVRWDKAAVVRLQVPAGEPALAVFGRPPFGGVLAVRSTAVRGGEALAAAVDATVVGRATARSGVGGGRRASTLPPSVTGPAWAGLLPPRGRMAAGGGVRPGAGAEGGGSRRSRSSAPAPRRCRAQERTRAALDALAEELWTRPYQGTTLRVVHAAHALGFLRGDGDDAVALLAAGPWTRLRTGYGSVAVRRESPAAGLELLRGLTAAPASDTRPAPRPGPLSPAAARVGRPGGR